MIVLLCAAMQKRLWRLREPWCYYRCGSLQGTGLDGTGKEQSSDQRYTVEHVEIFSHSVSAHEVLIVHVLFSMRGVDCVTGLNIDNNCYDYLASVPWLFRKLSCQFQGYNSCLTVLHKIHLPVITTIHLFPGHVECDAWFQTLKRR